MSFFKSHWTLSQKTIFLLVLYIIFSGNWVLHVMLSAIKKEHLHICLVLENLLFQKTNDIIAMLLLTFLHFIMHYVILTKHINFQMPKLETIISIDIQSLILLNSLQINIILF